MSDATERPAGAEARTAGSDTSPGPDPDAWATACREDLAAEQARRREQYGRPPVSAAEELRRFADAVADRIAQFSGPLAGAAAQGAAQGVAQQLIAQARAVVEPVVERNPRLFDHLAAAGQELLAAYHAAVQGEEQRWTRTSTAASPDSGPETPNDIGHDQGDGTRHDKRDKDGHGDGPTGSQRIDLD